nr:hypothetical protein [uncultured Flavobacterium sp.]
MDSLTLKINKIKTGMMYSGKTITVEKIMDHVLGKVQPRVKLLEEFQKHNDEMKALLENGYAEGTLGCFTITKNHLTDLTSRENQTIVRYLDYDNNQLVGGQNIWTLNTTADYSLSKNLTIIIYYNHSFSKPIISTSYPLTNIKSGITLRYTFGN